MTDVRWIVPLDKLSIDDVAIAGGKNASLGEMIRHLTSAGIRVPGGFAVTSAAYWEFVDGNAPVNSSRTRKRRVGRSRVTLGRGSAT